MNMKKYTYFVLLTFLFSMLIMGQSQKENFKTKFENFMKTRIEKSKQINSQKTYNEFKSWQEKEVKNLLKLAPSINTAKIDLLYPLGVVYQLAGKYKNAIPIFEKYLKEKPEDIKTITSLIQCYTQDKKAERAYQYLKKYYSKITKNQAVIESINVGETLSDEGKYKKAEEMFKLALKLRPPKGYEAYVIELIADIYIAQDNKEKAKKYLNTQLLKYQSDPKTAASLKNKIAQLNLINIPAPKLEVDKWVDNKSASLDSLRGKVVLIDFWAPWCPPCRAFMKHIVPFYNKYHKNGLEIISVTGYYGTFSDGVKRVKNVTKEQEFNLITKFIHERQIPWLVCVANSNNTAKNYHVRGIPQLVVVDKKGIIKKIEVGFNPNSNKLENYVKELLKK